MSQSTHGLKSGSTSRTRGSRTSYSSPCTRASVANRQESLLTAAAPPAITKKRRKRCSNSCPENNKGRLLMRPWLRQLVDSGEVDGLVWEDDAKTIVRIPWRHASRHGWELDSDADLFKRWAQHTGKYEDDGKEAKCAKRWKANFRCALNSLPGMKELTKSPQKRGHNAYKLYQFVETDRITHKPEPSTSRTGGPKSTTRQRRRRAVPETYLSSTDDDEDDDDCAHAATQESDSESQYCPPTPAYADNVPMTSPDTSLTSSTNTKSEATATSLLDMEEHSYCAMPPQPVIPTVVEGLTLSDSHQLPQQEQQQQQLFRIQQPSKSDLMPLLTEPQSPPSDDGSQADSGYMEEEGFLAEVLSEMDCSDTPQEFCTLIFGREASNDVLTDTIVALQRDCDTLPGVTTLKATPSVIAQAIPGATTDRELMTTCLAVL